jgi:hypothetical protein
MKRIFGRDKPKITKVIPVSREIVTGGAPAAALEVSQFIILTVSSLLITVDTVSV